MKINLEMIHMLKLSVKDIEATMKNNLKYLQEKMKIINNNGSFKRDGKNSSHWKSSTVKQSKRMIESEIN